MNKFKESFKEDAQRHLDLFFKHDRRLIFPDLNDPKLIFGHYPKVSIIIVAYTQTALELLCLQSIRQTMQTYPYEVIISNNGSSEENQRLMSSISNAVIVQNKGNEGFVRGVNIGVEKASGQYIFLLNDDAILTKGCVDHLLNRIDPWRVKNIGVVGGQIITLDGKVQDAGGILWRNGIAAEYGKGEDPAIGDVNFFREVNYVSGACFMTPRELFEDLGGFDEQFSPGYCEESDYCCRVREKGYRVVYEPTAKLLHYEYGSTEGKGVNALVKEHTEVLYQKHKELLKENHDPSAPVVYARATHRYSGRVLIINDIIPHSYLGEDSQKLLYFIKQLILNNFFVTLFPLYAGTDNWESAYEEIPDVVEIMLHENIGALSKLLPQRPRFYDYIVVKEPDKINLPSGVNMEHIIRKTNFFKGKYAIELGPDEPFDSYRLKQIYKPTLLWVDWHVPEYDTNAGDYAVYSYCSMFKELGFKIKYWSDDPNWPKQKSKYLKELLDDDWEILNLSGLPFDHLMADLGHTIDLAVVARPLAINYIKPIRNFTKAPIIYYCHDLHYLRERRMAEILNRQDLLKQADETLQTEVKITRDTDLFVTVSEHEKSIVDEKFPEKTSLWVWYSPAGDRRKRPEGKAKLLFLGGMQHTANVDGLEWFIKDIYPIIKERLNGNVQLDVIGSNPEKVKHLEDGETVFIRGFVEQYDLSEWFQSAHIFIAPIRFGAGFKGKIAMSISHGLPVVTTALGIEGMGIAHGNEVYIAGDAEDFADGVVRLVSKHRIWGLMSDNCRAFAIKHWSGDVVKDKLIEDIRRLDMGLLRRLTIKER
jgi:GT2 family glycosyltransferase